MSPKWYRQARDDKHRLQDRKDSENLLMSLSGMVEIPRLQAKRKFVMPAKPVLDLDRGAGIQVGARG